MPRKGLYIHIPFCKSRCLYCDFYSNTAFYSVEKFVEKLCQEFLVRSYKQFDFSTIYLGGGTPSSIGVKNLDRLFSFLTTYVDIAKTEEFTVECNPDDIDKDIVNLFKNYGVNRLSLGVQSLNDDMLRFLNRRHNSEKVYSTIDLLHSYGFGNISVDMIFGLPRLQNYDFSSDLQNFLSLDIQHFSSYALSFEESSPLTKLLQEGRVESLSDDEYAEQYDILCNELSHKGFDHYEVSNWCKAGYHSRHNSDCWSKVPYLGIGPSACSFDGNKRRQNLPDLNRYINEKFVPYEEEILSDKDKYNETIQLGFRTNKGINLNDIDLKFRNYFLQKLQHYEDNIVLPLSYDSYRITEDKWFLLDSYVVDFFI